MITLHTGSSCTCDSQLWQVRTASSPPQSAQEQIWSVWRGSSCLSICLSVVHRVRETEGIGRGAERRNLRVRGGGGVGTLQWSLISQYSFSLDVLLRLNRMFRVWRPSRYPRVRWELLCTVTWEGKVTLSYGSSGYPWKMAWYQYHPKGKWSLKGGNEQSWNTVSQTEPSWNEVGR